MRHFWWVLRGRLMMFGMILGIRPYTAMSDDSGGNWIFFTDHQAFEEFQKMQRRLMREML